MMKKLKKLLCMLLCLALALPLFSALAPTQAAAREYEGLISYWQFEEIYGEKSYDACMYLGDLCFKGRLSRVNSLSDSEVDRIIGEALKSKGMDKNGLKKTLNYLELAKNAPPQGWSAVADVFLGLIGADTYISIFKYCTGLGGDGLLPTLTDVNQGIALEALGKVGQEAIENEAKKALAKLVVKFGAQTVGFGLSVAVNAGTMAAGALIDYLRDKDGQLDRDIQAQHKKLVDLYEEINRRIARADDVAGGCWRVKIDSTVTESNVRCFGVGGNTIVWRLACELDKMGADVGEAIRYGGNYFGSIGIRATADLSGTQDQLMVILTQTALFQYLSALFVFYGQNTGSASCQLTALEKDVMVTIAEGPASTPIEFSPEKQMSGSMGHHIFLGNAVGMYDASGQIYFGPARAWCYGTLDCELAPVGETGASIFTGGAKGTSGVTAYGFTENLGWDFGGGVIAEDPNIFGRIDDSMSLYIVGG